MDTLLDTLCEGRLSFLEISTFPEMLIYSTPTISSRNWSPKPETFFREAVDFTAIHTLPRMFADPDKCIQKHGYIWIHLVLCVSWTMRMLSERVFHHPRFCQSSNC